MISASRPPPAGRPAVDEFDGMTTTPVQRSPDAGSAATASRPAAHCAAGPPTFGVDETTSPVALTARAT